MSKTLKQVRAGRLVCAVVYTTAAAGDSPRARTQKQRASTAARDKLNARTSFQKLERTLAANFDNGDLFITLTYDDTHLPEDREELKKALLDVMDFDGQILMEERIYGRELTVAVLGERALPAVEIQPCGKDFDYIAKYQAGSSRELCPAPITPQQQQQAGAMALKLHKALGLAVYSRTDLLMDEAGQLWCLEVNSLPGMTPTSLVPQEAAAVGMDYGTLCEEIVNLSYPLKRR